MQQKHSKIQLLLFPILLVAYEMAVYLSNDMYLPALPTIANDFATDYYYAQWTLTSWFLGASAFQLIVGPLADRYGRRPVLMVGGVIFILATLLCAFSNNLFVFIIARFLQGSAVCSAVVAGYAVIHELFDHKNAVKIMAVMGSVTVLAPSLGPLLGSFILLGGAWQHIFLLIAISASISLALLYCTMPETLSADKQHDIALKKQMNIYFAILKNKIFMLKTSLFCLLFMGMIAWIAIGPFLVIDDFNKTPVQFGIYQIIVFGTFIIGTNVTRRLTERKSLLWLVCVGTLLSTLGGLLAIGLVWFFPNSLLSLVLPLSLFSLGAGICLSPLNRLAIASCEQPMGSVMAVFSSLMSVFGMVGTVIVGVLYMHTLLPVALLLGVISLLSVCILYCLNNTCS